MKNKAYYFSHDGNAHKDFKIQFLIDELGMEGYGIYWFLIESLFDAGGYLPLRMAKILAKQMGTTEPKVKTIIMNYELFQISDEQFFSSRLLKSIENLDAIREKNSLKGKISAEKRKLQSIENQSISTAVEQRLNSGSTKEKKREEKKREEIIVFNKEKISELPDQYIQSSIEQLKIQKDTSVTREQVLGMWNIFKAQNLDSGKYYANESDFYKHFCNWIKNQKFEKNGKSTISSVSNQRMEQSIEYLNRYAKKDSARD